MTTPIETIELLGHGGGVVRLRAVDGEFLGPGDLRPCDASSARLLGPDGSVVCQVPVRWLGPDERRG